MQEKVSLFGKAKGYSRVTAMEKTHFLLFNFLLLLTLQKVKDIINSKWTLSASCTQEIYERLVMSVLKLRNVNVKYFIMSCHEKKCQYIGLYLPMYNLIDNRKLRSKEKRYSYQSPLFEQPSIRTPVNQYLKSNFELP